MKHLTLIVSVVGVPILLTLAACGGGGGAPPAPLAGTGGVALFNRCALDSTMTGHYANRRLFSGSPTDANGTLSNALPDMRFTLQ